jgi:autotransporter-associated beta strand protein
VLNTYDSSSQAITLESAGGTIQHPSSGSATLSGALTGPGGLTFTGTGTTILTGTNTYTGGTTVASGTLQGITTSLQGSITNNGRVVFDQPSTGTFTGSIVGTGQLVTQNIGTVVLSGSNTYTGGTQVNAGSILSINSGSALGSGTIDLVGSLTTPATLNTTATMNIANRITVAGDPIFNVAQTTTTTVSGVIADGSSSGDVVVQGGGTLELTAANTYTGPTTIDSGSTLALSGNGSIANSSVANSGVFNIQNTASNVSVAGFSQTSIGNLLMNISPTNNQQVNVTGAASLAGALSLNASAGSYTAGRYTLLTANGVTGTFGSFTSNLSSFTRLGYTLSYDANDVYLNFLPNLLDTQTSLQANVVALQGVYALQTGTVNNSLNYDCNNFGAKGFCVSTGGRYSNASESTANTTSAMIIAGYRINDHLRIGASADQNLYNTDVAQIASLRSNSPLMAAFVVWNQHADKTGFETKLAAAYNNSDLHVNRTAVGTSESGQGSTALNTLSESMTTSYAFKLGENYLLSPYAGVRHTSVSANGYSEHSTANVTSPLSYNGLNQESTSALLGVRLAGQIYKNTTIQTSAGFEEDMQNSVNNYSATGLAGISAITFNPSIQRTRAVASFGASYELAKGHRIGFNTIYRQESFRGIDTKMAHVNYSMEF